MDGTRDNEKKNCQERNILQRIYLTDDVALWSICLLRSHISHFNNITPVNNGGTHAGCLFIFMINGIIWDFIWSKGEGQVTKASGM